jgi:hypothetical protein
MVVKPSKATDFYKGIVNIYFKAPRPAPSEQIPRAVYSYLHGAWRQHQMLAMAALDLGLGLERARGYLAESASAYVDLQRRTGKSSSPEFLQTMFRVSTCRDQDASRAFSKGYLETPEGKRGEMSPRMMAATPTPDDHWWHLANVLALFYGGDQRTLDAAVEELDALPPRKGFAHSGDWWKEIVPLAVHCLTAATPDPGRQLVVVAEINQKMFARDDKDFFYEAWFAEIAMSFAAAAAVRGWSIPDDAPHPSMPLSLLKLPPIKVPEHPWGELPAADPELAQMITRAAKGTAPAKKSAPAKKKASAKSGRD